MAGSARTRYCNSSVGLTRVSVDSSFYQKEPCMETIKINEEYIRLDSLMKFSGLCNSGGRAKYLIQNGEVKLNGEVCEMRGKKIRPCDKVEYNGRTVEVIGD